MTPSEPYSSARLIAPPRRPALAWLLTIAALVILILALIMPLWLPRLVRSIIPDRYIVAYAPDFVQDIVFNTTRGRALPTLAPVPAVAEQQLFADLASRAGTPTPLPTVVAAIPSQPAPGGPTPTLTPALIPQGVTPPPAPVGPIQNYVLLTGFTYDAQGWNNCGPTTLAMGLSYWGLEDDQFDVASALKPDPEDSNVSPHELAAYARSRGLGAIWRINGELGTLKQLLSEGYPVLIERGFDELPDLDWMGHYMLLVGYSEPEQSFYALDSYWGLHNWHEDMSFPYDTWGYARLDELWRHFNRTYLVVYPPQDYEAIAAIIGDDMNDQVMLQTALQRAYNEVSGYDDTFAWYNLGSVLTRLGDYQNAATAFDLARARGLPWRMYWYHFDLYEAYYQVGRYEDLLTLALYTADPTNYPESEEAHYYSGLVYQVRGQTTAARNAFNRALRYNPTFQPARTALEQLDAGGG